MTSIIKISRHKSNTRSIYWFRKCLRLHDNPALVYALENSYQVYPIFILDPWFVQNARVGPNRWRFLLQSLKDLNESLMKLNSRLLLVRGSVIPSLTERIKEWDINLLCFESDTEPYARKRDAEVKNLAIELDVDVVTKCSHTLYDPDYLFKKNGNKLLGSYQGFQALCAKIGDPPRAVPAPVEKFSDIKVDKSEYLIPSLSEIGVDESKCGPNLFVGGETEALKRFHEKFQNEAWIASFHKPSTSPNSLEPSTTVLSPYLKFGCMSVRVFYERLKQVYRKIKSHGKPPESLEGQLLFREYFYFIGANTENFDKMKGNAGCRQIPWDENEEYVKAWKEGRTGYPFIDAIMTQLRTEGWIHHLGRHAVACFLTRGDLYQSWEKGQEVFEEYLLDADWSLNAANWQWLSASQFFHQYWKCYSPVEFGRKTDKNGQYIKKYLPALKKIPIEYIYEPWKAPMIVQQSAKCIIGVDYPKPIVDHKVDGKICMERMKMAFAAIKEAKEAPKADVDAKPARPKTEPKAKATPKKPAAKAAAKPKAESKSAKSASEFFKPVVKKGIVKRELSESEDEDEKKPPIQTKRMKLEPWELD